MIFALAAVIVVILVVVLIVSISGKNETPLGESVVDPTQSTGNGMYNILPNTSWANEDIMLQFHDNGKVGLYFVKDGSISVSDWIIENNELTLFNSENPDVEPITYSVAITDDVIVWGPFVLRRSE